MDQIGLAADLPAGSRVRVIDEGFDGVAEVLGCVPQGRLYQLHGRLLTAMFSVGTALHLTSRGIDRLARCAADDCERVFADVTRNGRKTYCSTRCTNRCAVRRHRART